MHPVRKAAAVSDVAGALSILIGIAVVTGWAADVPMLKSVAVGFATMKANTAVCFILAGASLWLLGERDRSRRVNRSATAASPILALVVAAVAAITLSEDWFRWNAGIDEILLRDMPSPEAGRPGRMSPVTAIDFLMVCASLLLLATGRRRPAAYGQALASVVAVVAVFVLLGYLYSAPGLYEVGPFSAIALHTALALLALSVGLLAEDPGVGWVAILLSDTPTATMGRRLFAATIIVLPLLGWLCLEGRRAGWYGTEFGLGIVIASAMVILAVLVGVSTRVGNLAEQQIGHLAQLNELFIEHAPASLAMFDRRMRCLAASRRWLAENRLTGTEVVGRSYYDLLPETPARWRAIHERGLQGSVERAEQDRFDRADGTVQWLHWEVRPWRLSAGEIGGILIFTEDITERRRAEEERERLRSEMERAMAIHVAGQTAAMLAHDLNQPLNAVASYSEAALQLLQAGNPKPQQLEHALKAGAEQAQRAGRTVRDLLQFLQKGESREEAVQLEAVARSATALVQSPGHDGFRATVDAPAQMRPVRANRLQLERVLVNLLRNSLEAMRNAGTAGPSTRITIATAGEPNLALITVSDNGPGLTPEAAQRAFDPFFTTKPDGLGMGLAICRSIIEAHGGKLWIDAHAGGGATFRFTVPFVDA